MTILVCGGCRVVVREATVAATGTIISAVDGPYHHTAESQIEQHPESLVWGSYSDVRRVDWQAKEVPIVDLETGAVKIAIAVYAI